MKKRFLQIATAISAATMLAACSQTDLIDDGSVKNNGTADNNAVTFGTYTAKKGGTRAGYEGNMNNANLQSEGGGFGVFAYHTPGEPYSEYRGDGTNTQKSKKYANFMYNQKVTYDQQGGYWTYDPLKYWPNDFTNGNVDDNNNPEEAKGSGNNGMVSFFAYAPYVTEGSGATGITRMTANDQPGDPRIKYTLGSNVDLLWGTFDDETGTSIGGNNKNVGLGYDENGSDYQKEIREGYSVAADLTKQKIDGKVKFNFIHALAAIGGNTEPDEPTEPEESPKDLSSGFLVRLALDDKNTGEESGAIDGGERKDLKDESGKVIGKQTVVTIKSITITNTTLNNSEITGEKGTLDKEENVVGTLSHTAWLNLATGKWESHNSKTASDKSDDVDQTIGTTETPDADNVNRVNLNSKIAEIKTAPETTYFSDYVGTGKHVIDYFKDMASHPGVTEKLQDVYANTGVPPIFLIPGDRPVLKINVVYVVRTYDENLNGECATVTNNITKNVVFPVVEMNKHYTLIMHLGLTSVKFTAKVSDWDKANGKTPTPGEDGDGEIPDEDIENSADIIIDLPANVGEDEENGGGTNTPTPGDPDDEETIGKGDEF